MFEKRCLYLRAGIEVAITMIATNPDIPSKTSTQVAAILQAVLDEQKPKKTQTTTEHVECDCPKCEAVT